MADDGGSTRAMSRLGGGARRPYRLAKRAEQQELTRRRIAEAAMDLHGSVGPARTTISAVAERAGVERLTVYRHFPDESALFAACSSRFLELNPPPDLAPLMAIREPDARLRAVLLALYTYYRQTEPMLTRLIRDAESVPLVREYLGPYRTLLTSLTDALAAGFGPVADPRQLRAAVGHALAFTSWRSLALEQGLADGRAAELMTRLAVSAVWYGQDSQQQGKA